ncbi:MAG: hypothetical protein EBS68_12890 [Rhodobacteraceae bacterium]|nr:hypothetical protein [Paracoccaceae bacterium]
MSIQPNRLPDLIHHVERNTLGRLERAGDRAAQDRAALAATAQLVGKSFRSCMAWAQIFGLTSVMVGLYFSAELGTGSGSMIALVSAILFASVGTVTTIRKSVFLRAENMN